MSSNRVDMRDPKLLCQEHDYPHKPWDHAQWERRTNWFNLKQKWRDQNRLERDPTNRMPWDPPL